MYPIKFNNILKYRIWGGNSIMKKLSRENNTNYSSIGESWDISDRDGDESIVINGALKGLTLKDLREKYGKTIFGSKFDVSKPFPLLVKILDAREDLSLQVHPRKKDIPFLAGNPQSKSEFWYILEHEKDAKIMAGLKNGVSKEDFIANLESYNLLNFINLEESQNNRLIYVESGTIHAIGGGNLILEIQENSDTTYRVSDWGRLDSNSKPRELHIAESLQCIDFENPQQAKITDVDVKRNYTVVDSDYFTTNNYAIEKEFSFTATEESCCLLSLINGEIKVGANNESIVLAKGDTILLPAGLTFIINNNDSKYAHFLITTPKY
ncbi:MAG: class I mannose-6-phosphate isomerase [Alphaproteobacteria bacterium]|nr:class I mannose-6-phosphate isomerase [Alphaproteobacteria bacterium]